MRQLLLLFTIGFHCWLVSSGGTPKCETRSEAWKRGYSYSSWPRLGLDQICVGPGQGTDYPSLNCQCKPPGRDLREEQLLCYPDTTWLQPVGVYTYRLQSFLDLCNQHCKCWDEEDKDYWWRKIEGIDDHGQERKQKRRKSRDQSGGRKRFRSDEFIESGLMELGWDYKTCENTRQRKGHECQSFPAPFMGHRTISAGK